MPTSKPTVSIIVDDCTMKKIEDFQYNNRFKNRSVAINFIIKAGMRALAEEYPELSPDVCLETGKKTQGDGVNGQAQRVHI